MREPLAVRFVFIFLVWIGMSGPVARAQDFDSDAKNKFKMLKLANHAFEQGNYYVAADLYKKAYILDPEDAYMPYKIAMAFKAVREYRKAASWYKTTYDISRSKYPLVLLEYANMLKMLGQYGEAIKHYEAFKKNYKGRNASIYHRKAKKGIKDCEYAQGARFFSFQVDVENLHQVNAGNSDLAPLPLGEDRLIYSTSNTDTLVTLKNKQKNYPWIKLYYTEKNGNGWEAGKLYEEGPFNGKNAHTANGRFSPDKKAFYFTKCKKNKTHETICHIYVSRKKDNTWQTPEPLKEPVNLPNYSSTHPALGFLNDDEILYFASNRPGGRGGYDIWFIPLKSKTRSRPQNMGSRINTSGDELTPFFDSKRGILYFSSNGHIGFGGLDNYMAIGSGRRFGKPDNLGNPFNSSYDDYYYILIDSIQDGFFVSNRPGGMTIDGETCCDDIYTFKWPVPMRLAVMGDVYEKGDPQKKTVEGAKVEITLQWIKKYIRPREDSVDLNRLYYFDIDTGWTYYLTAKKEGFFNGYARLKTSGIRESDTIHIDLELERFAVDKTFTLQNLYYEFNKADVKPESAKALRDLLNLLVDNPKIVVELGSHTDSKGTPEYNRTLSQKRAETVVKFLIKKGVDPKRVVAKGYGETQPIAPNTNADGSDNPEGRRLNRRTELKIISQDFKSDG